MEQPNDNQEKRLQRPFSAAARRTFPLLHSYSDRISNQDPDLDRRNLKSMECLKYMIEQAHHLSEALAGHDAHSLMHVSRQERMGLLGFFKSIGEKARKVAQPHKEQYTDVPWHALVSMRNGLAHNMPSFVEDDVWKDMTRFFMDEFPVLQWHLHAMARQHGIRPVSDNDNDPPDSDLNYVA